MKTHSSILSWRISWTEELGGLQSMGPQRVRHNWMTNTTDSPKNLEVKNQIFSLFTVTCICVCMYMFTYTYASSQVKVTQSCPTLCDPMDHTVHRILQGRILEWVSLSLLQGIFPTQGLNPGLLHCRQILYQLSHQGSQYTHMHTHT